VILQPNGDFSFTLNFPATKNPGDRQHVPTIYVSAGDMAGVGKSQTDTVRSIDAERTPSRQAWQTFGRLRFESNQAMQRKRDFSSLLVAVYGDKND
jgi:hypothetical protein